MENFPILLITCGGDNVSYDVGGPCHGTEPGLFLCFRGRWHNLMYWPAFLPSKRNPNVSADEYLIDTIVFLWAPAVAPERVGADEQSGFQLDCLSACGRPILKAASCRRV